MAKRKRLSDDEVRRLVLETDSDDECSLGSRNSNSDIESDSDDSDSTVIYDPGTSNPGVSNPGTDAGDSSGSWKKTFGSSADSTFRSSVPPGPKNLDSSFTTDSTALEYFELFFTDSMWVRLRDMTNLRAAQVKASKPKDFYASHWSDLSLAELKAFVGCRLSMEYAVVKRRLEQYFSAKSGFLFQSPGYRTVFTRDRFLAIWKFLHVCDEESTETDKTDKLYKVRPILNSIVPMFQNNYSLQQDISLDEGMIPSKNRLSIKQYIQSKPVKWGIKAFLLCESATGYIYNVEIYTGRTDGLFVPELGASGSVVARLTHCIEGLNHKVFMDRFYNSPSLSQYLLDRKIHTCGTIMPNRKQFPKQLQRRKKDMQRGQHDYLCNQAGVSCTVWCDRSPIYFISTFHNPTDVSSVNRKERSGTVVPVSCPVVVKEYTAAMGGCDLNDQMTKLYRSRRHYRWPRRLLMKCMLWCAYNAYIVEGHVRQHSPAGHRSRTFYDFLDELCLTLVGEQRTASVRRNRAVSLTPEERLQNVGLHHPERPAEATTNQTCVVCREKANKYMAAHPGAKLKDIPFKKTKTVFRCSLCKVYLCIRECSSCWLDYHSKVQFWR